MDEMAMLSDLLLPENAALEGHVLHMFPGSECTGTTQDPEYPLSNHAVVVRKGVKPLYNTMDGNDQLIEIFDRMGMIGVWNMAINRLGSIGFTGMNSRGVSPPSAVTFDNPEIMLEPEKKYTSEEIYDLNLKSAFGPDKGLDYLDEHRVLYYKPVDIDANFYTSHRDSKTRFQLYLMSQKRSGKVLVPALKGFPVDLGELIKFPLDELERRFSPLPYWPVKTRIIDSEPAEFEFYSFVYRQPLFMFRLANMDQDPVRRDYANKYLPDNNAILIHTDTANRLEISQGERIVVESPYGKTQGNAYVTETVRPDSIGIGGARGRKTKALGEDLLNDTNYNDIMCGDFGYFDPLHGGTINTMRVKVYKA
jgi:anaerobic selenocysteine-containing dehydrogenase